MRKYNKDYLLRLGVGERYSYILKLKMRSEGSRQRGKEGVREGWGSVKVFQMQKSMCNGYMVAFAGHTMVM